MFGRIAALMLALILITVGCLAEPEPTVLPTPEPASEPTPAPAEEPTQEPTEEPTAEPTGEPTAGPTEGPTEGPMAEPTGEPTGEPTESPTAGPAEEPTAEPTGEPTESPTAGPAEEPTAEPTGEPTESPTEGPTAEPTGEPTGEPSAEPTEGPSEAPTSEPTPAPTPAADAQAWFFDANGMLYHGDLALILPFAQEKTEIYIMAEPDFVMWIMDVDEEILETMAWKFVPDPEKYPDPKRISLHVQLTPPEGMLPPDDIHSYLYVWLEEIPVPTPAPTEAPEQLPTEPPTEQPTEAPTPVPEITPDPNAGGTDFDPNIPGSNIQITVDAADYTAGAWSGTQPAFTLGGVPEEAGNCSYAAIVYDERFVILSGDTYTARDEGTYDIRFAILDGIGDVLSLSDIYSLQLDYTPPAYIMVSMLGDSYTDFTVYTEDALSGITGYSVDGGVTWVAPDVDGGALFSAAEGSVIPAGSIMAKDAAGNTTVYPDDFILPEKISYGGGGGYYGGGGGGGGSNQPEHAPTAQEVELNPYNALTLEIPVEPMTELTVGGMLLPFAVALNEHEGFEPAEDYAPTFTAALAKWTPPVPPEGEETEVSEGSDEEPDTIILTLTPEPAIPGEHSYTFTVNGVVFRMLFNSGIDYVVLVSGDSCAAFPTAGFTAGSEFTRLKTEGVSTKKFDYTIDLLCDNLALRPFGMEIEVAVEQDGESITYMLTDDETQDMYYYDVQIGGVEMMDVPYGEYIPEEPVTEGETANE